MKYIKLGKTDETVSTISLGTWAFGGPGTVGKNIPVGWANQNKDDSISVLKKSHDSGINHWDTADVYGDGISEKIIGETWKDISRSSIFLATKVGWDMGEYDYFYHPKLIKKNIDRSFNNLKTDYIDLFYLHHCNFKEDQHFFEAIEIMDDYRKAGKIRFLGISDWDCKKIMKYIDKYNFDVVQPYRNVMDSDYSFSGLKKYISENDLGVCFFSPIKHGLLTGKYLSPPTFQKGDHRLKIKEFFDQKTLNWMVENKEELVRKFSHHPNPVLHGLIGSLLEDSPAGCVLLGQRNIEQVEVAKTLGDALSKEDSDWVKNLYRKNHSK